MKLNNKWLLALVLSFFVGIALAESPKPGDPCKSGESCWDRAAVASYGNGSVRAAIEKLAHKGVIPDAQLRQRVQENLLRKVESRDILWTVAIPNNYRTTNMVFAEGVLLPNVVAGVDKWSAGQSRLADFYEYREGGHIYMLVRPHVCSNWSLRIITPQGLCVVDEILCEGECLKVRKALE